MVMKNFKILSLSGNCVSTGIKMEEGKFSVSGGPSRTDRILCHGVDPNQTEYILANVGRKDEKVFLKPTDGEPDADRVLVLVHEYSHGSGSKRWPSFHINWENAGQVEVLAQASRGSGSGSDSYSLILAPYGWAENIAAQFVDERDYGGQVIAYVAGFVKPVQSEESFLTEEQDENSEIQTKKNSSVDVINAKNSEKTTFGDLFAEQFSKLNF